MFTDPDIWRYPLDDLIMEEVWTADVIDRSLVMFHNLVIAYGPFGKRINYLSSAFAATGDLSACLILCNLSMVVTGLLGPAFGYRSLRQPA